METYVYQKSDHMPPWAIAFEYEFRDDRSVDLFFTLFSDEIDNNSHRLFGTFNANTPFHAACQMKRFCRENGVTFTTDDVLQIDETLDRYF